MLELKRARLQRDMHQAELAELLDVTQASISLWELGKTRPSRAARKRLENVFGLPAHVLLSAAVDPHSGPTTAWGPTQTPAGRITGDAS